MMKKIAMNVSPVGTPRTDATGPMETAARAYLNDGTIPDDLEDPITRCLMHDPVVLNSGSGDVCDRTTFEATFSRIDRDPMTNIPAPNPECTPVLPLRKKYDEFRAAVIRLDPHEGIKLPDGPRPIDGRLKQPQVTTVERVAVPSRPPRAIRPPALARPSAAAGHVRLAAARETPASMSGGVGRLTAGQARELAAELQLIAAVAGEGGRPESEPLRQAQETLRRADNADNLQHKREAYRLEAKFWLEGAVKNWSGPTAEACLRQFTLYDAVGRVLNGEQPLAEAAAALDERWRRLGLPEPDATAEIMLRQL